jgi:hypothetical protein
VILQSVLAIAAGFVVVFLAGFVRRPVDPIAALKRRFLKLSRFTPAQASEALEERVEALSRKFPGRSYRWYLQWLVTDLERAKR